MAHEFEHPPAPREVVLGFLTAVRSGRRPDDAGVYLAATVACHQLESEGERTIHRTPDEYAAHVRELVDRWGSFTVDVDDLLADGDRVYARWTQHGSDIHGPGPARPVAQITSATYRVEQGLIAEYWIQIDRFGVHAQTAAARTDPPNGLPRYRLLTGPDDEAFCRRVTDALDVGFALHGSPAATHDGKRVIVAQAIVWAVPR